MPRRNVVPALFDIRPKNASGKVDVARIANLNREINLRPTAVLSSKDEVLPDVIPPLPESRSAIARQSSPTRFSEQLTASTPIASHKEIIAKEIEEALTESASPVVELVNVGATMPVAAPASPAPQKTEPNPQLEEFWSANAVPTATPISASGKDVEVWLDNVKKRRSRAPVDPQTKLKRRLRNMFSKRAALAFIVGAGLAAGIGAAAVSSSEVVAKQHLMENGASAIANLENAKKSLEAFDFAQAADNFALAKADFGEASGMLSKFGASFLSSFGDIPGLSKVRSANNLVLAGQYLSESGQNLSAAFYKLSQTDFGDMIHPEYGAKNTSLLPTIDEFQRVLLESSANIYKAKELLADVDVEAIPEDKRELFQEFTAKIPLFQEYINQAITYSDFLHDIVGANGAKTYMVLLQNNSEKRPTGGFPGTYAIVSFDHGTLKKVFVDDIYNPDGQITANIIPPKPLQHISPNLGLRDINWFADFPTTAKKIEEYYALDRGPDLDGVFTVTPTVIARLLDVIGPIDLPEYGRTLSSDNVLAELQDEVEYKGDRSEPKKIVADFQVQFFSKLAQQDSSSFLPIMKVLLTALQEKHILAYFNTPSLQKQVLEHGFGGELKSTEGDYIQVAFANIKGWKGDAVTSNAMRLRTEFIGEQVRHGLTITRAHNGGTSKYQFYNKELPTYVKVYVPKDAVLDSIDGHSYTAYDPLLNYDDFGFKEDDLVASIEAGTTHPFPEVDVFEESGKTVFGFWLVVKPQQTVTTSLTYHLATPRSADRYALYWQKQSGAERDYISVSTKIPAGKTFTGEDLGMQTVGDSVVVDTDLVVDRNFSFSFR